jgi:hypothetical protein
MSDEEYDKAHATIMKRLEWLDLQLSWTTCDATHVRYSSWAAMTLKDIQLDRAHGPQQDTGPGKKGMVSLVLCPGEPHKDRYKHTKVIGMWQHIKPFRCATGALAMTLMVHSHFDPKISRVTLYKNVDGDANWWNIPLHTKWGTKPNSAETAFKSIYQEAKISWSKNLHLRKGGMDKAGTAGVSEEAVSTSYSTLNQAKQAGIHEQPCHS